MRTEPDLRDAIDELAAEASYFGLLAASLERRIARRPSTAIRFARPRLRLVYAAAGGLVVAVVVVAAVVAAGVLRSTTRTGSPPPQNGVSAFGESALVEVTWTDPASRGTVEFTATTARVSDGCSAGLYGLTIGPHTLDVGKPIGTLTVCGGTARPPAGPQRVAYDRQQAAVARFDRVLSGRSTWRLSGATLTVTKPGAATIVLRPSGPAVTVAGEHWILHQAVEHNYSISGSLTAATLSIGHDGTVKATDPCNGLTGTATITTTTIDFGQLSRTQVACLAINPKAQTMIDTVLSGRITYSIVNDKLYLYGPDDGDILVYWLT